MLATFGTYFAVVEIGSHHHKLFTSGCLFTHLKKYYLYMNESVKHVEMYLIRLHHYIQPNMVLRLNSLFIHVCMLFKIVKIFLLYMRKIEKI